MIKRPPRELRKLEKREQKQTKKRNKFQYHVEKMERMLKEFIDKQARKQNKQICPKTKSLKVTKPVSNCL